MASNDNNPELDSFREQWRAEVRSKVPGPRNETQQSVPGPANATSAQQKSRARVAKAPEAHKTRPPIATKKVVQQSDDEEEYVSKSFDEPAAPADSSSLHAGEEEVEGGKTEPVSALEHFEQAVEREAAGNLGDSLRLYRKAYRVSICSLPTVGILDLHSAVGSPCRPPVQKEALPSSHGPQAGRGPA
jgi:F-box protein 9